LQQQLSRGELTVQAKQKQEGAASKGDEYSLVKIVFGKEEGGEHSLVTFESEEYGGQSGENTTAIMEGYLSDLSAQREEEDDSSSVEILSYLSQRDPGQGIRAPQNSPIIPGAARSNQRKDLEGGRDGLVQSMGAMEIRKGQYGERERLAQSVGSLSPHYGKKKKANSGRSSPRSPRSPRLQRLKEGIKEVLSRKSKDNGRKE